MPSENPKRILLCTNDSGVNFLVQQATRLFNGPVEQVIITQDNEAKIVAAALSNKFDVILLSYAEGPTFTDGRRIAEALRLAGVESRIMLLTPKDVDDNADAVLGHIKLFDGPLTVPRAYHLQGIREFENGLIGALNSA
ncbi:hypothetical protein J8273_7964 [Carpediemonas membranifera]|uniref:Uncharacterized protein n=1 Tax=Carpediemonas membranifera TaxID=201153 RepID=A0A8J6AQ65_9EUKA|nr:hypothetical protein J8273_7964 [Carpediemonas membranifera]|eukprot:KAG9390613.1 hypothetical protein J8273_7964 [Carpediemonas membranifera]